MSLGDPTRRAIYLTIRESREAMSVVDVAEVIDLHPTSARYHLDHLVQAGYLRMRRVSAGSGVGRPAHLYEATDRSIHIDLPAQNFELLAGLFKRAFQGIGSPDAVQRAYDVGFTHGEDIVASDRVTLETDLAANVDVVADVMRGLGFEFSTEGLESGFHVYHCPFGDVALEEPRFVCAMHQGLVTGLMAALHQPVEVTISPRTTPFERCRMLITPARSSGGSPGTWELEPAHTTIAFIVGHLGLSKVRGRFTEFRATMEVGDDLELSSAEVWIEAASIYTGVKMRDDHLRSPDFLYVEQFPQLHFVSREVRRVGDDTWEADGDLTIRGVTRPVTLQVELTGVIDDPDFQTRRAGFVATTEITREDYDMHWNMPLGIGGLVASRAQIEIDAEALLTPYVDPRATADSSS